MRVIYQSLFYKILVIAGCIVAFFSLAKNLFFLEEYVSEKSVITSTIWLLGSILYLLDIYVFQRKRKKKNDIIMYFVIFVQIILPIINRNF